MNPALETLKVRAQELRAQILDRFGHDLVVTDRLKVMLTGAGIVLVFSLLLGLDSFVDGLETRHTRVQVDLERLKEQIETSSWQDRKGQSQVLKSILEERLWTAPTPGLAEAGFERWLRDRLTEHEMEPQQLQIRRVTVTTQAETGADQHPLANIQRMTVKIIMPFDQTGLIGFLENIASGDKTLVVDRLIARSGRNPRIEMDVSAFYRSQSSTAPGGGP